MSLSFGHPANNRKILLRVFVLAAAVAGTVFYLGIWRWWWLIPSNRRDGFDLIGPFLGTFYFALLVAPCWYFGIKNYALGIAGVLAVPALASPPIQFGPGSRGEADDWRKRQAGCRLLRRGLAGTISSRLG